MIQRDAKVIAEVEEIIGRTIPHVVDMKSTTFGIKMEYNKVVGLGLYRKGVTLLPESIGSLENLKYLYVHYNRLESIKQLTGINFYGFL